MPQKISPFIDAKYGWDFGESGWNSGMDENLLKFSFLLDGNIDSIVSSLPTAVNGKAHFLTTDNRVYYGVEGSYKSSSVPKNFIFKIKTTGEHYQFDGSTLVSVRSPLQVKQDLQSLESDFDALGTAAYEDSSSFVTPSQLDVTTATLSAYTDAQVAPLSDFVEDLQDGSSPSSGASLVAYDPALSYSNNSVGAYLSNLDSKLSSFVFAQEWVTSVEAGATDPVVSASQWEALRVYAENNKSTVFVPAGTYVLPQDVRLDADNTVWHFAPGAVLKLWDTQADNDFILFSSPVNQRVVGLRVDANRANQNSTTFGINNCAVLIIDANNCVFEDCEIISSPAKGFAIVSSAGGTNRNLEVRGFTGKDCNNQCLHVDGNNMTGFFDRIVIDGVRIGATSHAGVALNDGVHDVVISNVIADVQNTTWDAVAVRDSWDIQMVNIKGKRGRNGVQVQRLNGFTGRIQMDNVVGEQNSQNGILFLGCENINAGTITGRNNAAAGINIAATGGGYRCKNVTIQSPQGYDDRETPAQQWGVLVQGVDVARLGKHLAYGNTTKNVSINRSLCTDVQSEVYRLVSATSGSIAALSQASVTMTFAEPMDDSTYDVVLWSEVATNSRSVVPGHVITKTQNAIVVLAHNLNSSTAQEGTIFAKVTRRP